MHTNQFEFFAAFLSPVYRVFKVSFVNISMISKLLQKSMLLLVCSVLYISNIQANMENNSCKLDIMPCPTYIEHHPGTYSLKQTTQVYIQGMSQQRQSFMVNKIKQQLGNLYTSNMVSSLTQPRPNIVLSADQSNADWVIKVKQGSAYQLPSLEMDESYTLQINTTQVLISSPQEFGALHAITSLIQLFSLAHQDSVNNPFEFNIYAQTQDPKRQVEHTLPNHIDNLTIQDKPRFAWRGMLIDSVRHFIPIDDIKRQIDAMAASKLNVMHWHLTDDQGWRIEINSYPKLHQLASDGQYYTQQQIRDLVSYASLQGIRVIPEFDVPGHSTAIGVAYPELMSANKEYTIERSWGIFEPLLDPSNPAVYQFIDKMVEELSHLFPDSYMHIGGDEVNPAQWIQNKTIQAFMLEKSLHDSEDLHHFFNTKVNAILNKYKKQMIGWDEIYHQKLSKDVLIQSWRGLESISQFAKQGYKGILSTGYYIDQAQYTSYHYRNDPHNKIALYDRVTAINSPATKPSNETQQHAKLTNVYIGHHAHYQLKVPRLKGSDVIVNLSLLISQNTAEQILQNNVISAFVQFNQKAYKQINVRILPVPDHQQQNKLRISFNIDSWMGPLQFDLTLPSYLLLKNQTSTNALNDKDKNEKYNHVLVGNAYYPVQIVKTSTTNSSTFKKRHPPTDTQLNNIIGAEAALWSEMFSADNIDLRAWPRTFAIAERLWSSENITNLSSMYRRLWQINNYAAKTLQLTNEQQQIDGWAALMDTKLAPSVTNNKSEQTLKHTEIQALMDFTQMLEPAHYYTRHHIKYRQNQYHQQAPLNRFVDFLPVESYQVLALTFLLNKYDHLNHSIRSNILDRLNERLSAWQKAQQTVEKLILGHTKLNDLKEINEDVLQFLRISKNAIALCKENDSNLHAGVLLSQLRKIKFKQQEIVIAGIPMIEKLITKCSLNTQHSNALYNSFTWVEDGQFTQGVEGPAVDQNGVLYAVNYREQGTIGKINGPNQVSLLVKLANGSVGNGIRFDKQGNMYIADYVNHNILFIDNQSLKENKPITPIVYAHHKQMNQPNDIAITENGLIFASDPNWTNNSGNLWRIDTNHTAHLLESDMGTTNGVAVSPDNKILYVNESVQRNVWKYVIDEKGEISNKTLLIQFDDFGLDGMRTDKQGNLFIARYGKGVIAIVSPTGKLLREVPLQGKYPTNVAFSSRLPKQVFVTMQKRGAIESFFIE